MGGPGYIFWRKCKKITKMLKKKSGLRPENKGGPKIEKKVVFWHKNVKNFESGIHIFFSQNIFNSPMRPKGHFALKCTFPMETIVNKKS